MPTLEQSPFSNTLDRLSLPDFTLIPYDFPYVCRFSYASPVTGIVNTVGIQIRPFSSSYMMSINGFVDYSMTNEDIISQLNNLP